MLLDLGVRSEASGESEARGARLLFRSFEVNSGDCLTKTIEIRDRFPAAAVEHPKSDKCPRVTINNGYLQLVSYATQTKVKMETSMNPNIIYVGVDVDAT